MLYHIYHAACDDDSAADKHADELRPTIEASGGSVAAAYSHSHGSAYVVVSLPEGVDPADFGLSELVGSFRIEVDYDPEL